MTGQEFLGLLAFIAIYSIGTIAAIGSGLWITATYPRAMDSVQRLYRGRNFRCLLVGIVNTIILLALFLLLTKSPPLKLLGVLIGIVLVFLVISGLSVAFLDLGRRLLPDQVGDNTIRPVIVGARGSPSSS